MLADLDVQLANPARSAGECSLAKTIADRINNGESDCGGGGDSDGDGGSDSDSDGGSDTDSDGGKCQR